MRNLAIFAVLLAGSSLAHAGETPLYQPAPAWVKPAPAIDVAKLPADAPQVLIYDNQQRIDGDTVTTYLDTAQRAATAESLNGLGTVSFAWMPDKGDLIVHRIEILRGADHVDVLKSGSKFSVLRREQGLENRMLDGMLTATMPVEGLQVGDILRVTISIVQHDAALKGRAQTYLPLLAAPFRTQFGRGRILWPATAAVKFDALTDAVALKPTLIGSDREISVVLPLAKPDEFPGDAPIRFRKMPLVEASTFAGWADVSSTMAPLYATEGLIADGGPIAAETDAIAKALTDPLTRAEAALEIVQSKVRYLLMGMNGGNYVPERPAKTWALRYGDCKAKTVLLLAMLRRMGIEAEAVLVSSQLGDMLPKRLATPGAFDHVLVKATIAGKDYWLDGTGLGARIEDIADTPGFRYGLPIRAEGAALLPIAIRAKARPDFTLTLDMDERAGIGLPVPYRGTITFRGAPGAQMATAATQASVTQRREIVGRMADQFFGSGDLAEGDLTFDPATGIATITASGLLASPWDKDEKRYRQTLDAAVSKQSFSPDRARQAWSAIPVATDGPGGVLYRTRITLPDGGRGFTLEGDRTLPATLAGVVMMRKSSLENGVASIEDRTDEIGTEIAVTDLPAARAAFAAANTRLLRVTAPADYPANWQVVKSAQASGAIKPIEAAYAKLIAADPKEVASWRTRAVFRANIYDRAGSAADWSKVIELAPTVESYVARSQLFDAMGQPVKAMADAEAAFAIDPSDASAIGQLAQLRVDKGDTAKGLALLQAKIDERGKDRLTYVSSKAELQAQSGDVPGAITMLDGALAERPGLPGLLNARCWVKGTRNVGLDTALKDCTKAIELTDNIAGVLDSRAMVYFRLGRMDDALADLDSALDTQPDLAASLFMRGIVRTKLGKASEGAADIAAARFIAPKIDRIYKGYGITP